jgi:hypothetical protein
MKMKRVLFGLFIASLLSNTGCWCLQRKNACNNGYTRATPGCNECSGYGGPEMFGTPMTGNNAMLQSPGQGVDERLGTPAKQTPYEGPAKK